MLGKRRIDYVPPLYLERCARAALGLLPLGLIVALVCLIVARKSLAEKAQLRFFIATAVTLTLVGAAVSALDDWNDELWNPVMWGSPFIAALPLVALLLFWRRRAVWLRLVLGVIAVPILSAVLFLGGGEWIMWGLEHGWPVSW